MRKPVRRSHGLQRSSCTAPPDTSTHLPDTALVPRERKRVHPGVVDVETCRFARRVLGVGGLRPAASRRTDRVLPLAAFSVGLREVFGSARTPG